MTALEEEKVAGSPRSPRPRRRSSGPESPALRPIFPVEGEDGERGDVPGWVMITVMTAALVLAILIPFREAIVAAVQNALTSVTSGGG